MMRACTPSMATCACGVHAQRDFMHSIGLNDSDLYSLASDLEFRVLVEELEVRDHRHGAQLVVLLCELRVCRVIESAWEGGHCGWLAGDHRHGAQLVVLFYE